ncbi:dehydrogenase [Burkholderia sp. SFA1]|uniref:xanthine dehydrogenase family protein molybdopterin-binding subunit n=1 Tax=Caballeronia sp. CLC5 TaxID=2906764 RepID=UPI001F1D85A4|nr:xanthine dehydrogenase family protein molybdopterin-binding subunit [Caballeronia sp. CLC5]MCE4573676.1 xanthine dehydrogenase family protein molybdopterin-binding subunit [Caballeronia sp. CLC5]BBQ00521.1 dehydrogenase [Burkholderia sp. SFA1]
MEIDDLKGAPTDQRYIGKRVMRTEDKKLLQGQGSYVDDVHLPNMLQAAVLRSPHAHAKIVSIDCAAARELKGVHAVYTHADLSGRARGRAPSMLPNPAIRFERTQELLASTEVTFAGEAVAFVVADNRYIAEDACGLIEVEYDTLPAVADCRDGLRPESPLCHTEAKDNVVAHIEMGFGDIDAAFDGAPHVVEQTYWQNRGSAHPMETRGYLAEYHAANGELTVWSSGQAPHHEKKNLVELLEWDAEKLRVLMNDVGGGFGPKLPFYPEEALVAIAAVALKRPVKWIEDRREHFLAVTQERDQWWTVRMALESDGKIRGVKLEMVHDNGAFLPWGIITPYISITTTPGPYVIPAMGAKLDVVYTNKCATSPVRGAGRPQAVFAMERILDKAARTLGMDRAELRWRNLIQPEQMPYDAGFIYRDGSPLRYDSGDYPATQKAALERANYASFAERKAEARRQGRFVGIGMASFVEGTGMGPFEGATVRVQANGRIVVITGASPQGQGHKTTFAQICAEQLNVPLETIDVITGDTGGISMGVGTFASRVTVNAGNSVYIAAQAVGEKMLTLAAHLWKCEPEELLLVEGHVARRAGIEQRMSYGQLAKISQGMPGFTMPKGLTAGLEETKYFSPAQSTYCNGTAVVELEVDRETGHITILNYVMAHDSGKLINPLIVDGQVIGSVAHGIGNATLEWMQYDENAQPTTTNFGEYLLPMATDVPNIDIVHLETPSPLNPLGVKGAGEGGTIPAAAAIVAAIEDALSEYGVEFTEAPLVPQRVFQKLKEAGAYAR